MKAVAVTKIIIGFFVLFISYHAAEYMVLFKNSAPGFLALMPVFFLVAWLIAKWQGYKGLGAWGIIFNNTWLFLLVGLLIGLTVNSIAYLICLYFNIEQVSFIPTTGAFITQSSLLIFGTFFSSLSEDVVTRGYVFRHFNNNKRPWMFVLFSSAIYVLNHIYRLNEPVYLLYLFIIGIQLAIPLVFTKKIWYTLGCHWAGNIVYHITNTVMHSESNSNAISSMWIFILFMLFLIPVNYLVSKELGKGKVKTNPVFAQ